MLDEIFVVLKLAYSEFDVINVKESKMNASTFLIIEAELYLFEVTHYYG